MTRPVDAAANSDSGSKHDTRYGIRRPAKALLLAAFAAAQLILPLRHFAIEGDVAWTDEGHNFSWRMKLRDKRAREISFHTRDPDTGQLVVLPTSELSRRQRRKMSTRPHMINQYARHLSEKLRQGGFENAPVYVRSLVSLNGRDYRPLVGETVNLAAVGYSLFGHNEWITLRN